MTRSGVHSKNSVLMNPIKDLGTILSSQKVAQAQREAMVDIAVWAMYVDGTIKYQENARVDEVVEQLSTSTAIPLSQYLPTAISKIRDVWMDPSKSERILEEISNRLGSDEMRRTAYALCETVTHADDELAEAEQAFLERVRRQFGLDND